MLKALTQVLVTVLAGVYAQITDNVITQQEWIVVTGLGVGSFGVWLVPNLDAGIAKYAKGFVSFMTAGLPVLYVVIPGGLTTAETIEVILAGLAAIGFVVGVGNPDYRFAHKNTVGEAAMGRSPGSLT